jgi:hypothetical protein
LSIDFIKATVSTEDELLACLDKIEKRVESEVEKALSKPLELER